MVITGMMTHMCVDATARAAADLGFKVIVVEDACATRDLNYGETTIPAEHVHKAFLAALKSYGEVMPGNRSWSGWPRTASRNAPSGDAGS